MSLDATWYGKAMQQERESDVHLKMPFVAGVYVLMAIGVYSFQLDPDVPVLTTALLLVCVEPLRLNRRNIRGGRHAIFRTGRSNIANYLVLKLSASLLVS